MLFKKLWRTMGLYKAQFISMIIMIAIGVGMFVGFNAEWTSIQKNTSKFFNNTKLADYHVVTTEATGFTKEDAEKIKGIDGVQAATRFISANVEISERSGDALALNVSEDFTVSTFVLTGEGKDYDATDENGVWLSETYAAENDFKVGDQITLVYKSVIKFEGKVVGLIKSGENMVCVRDETQLMPDYEKFGYAFVSPAFYKKACSAVNMGDGVYSYINVRSDLDKKVFKEKVNDALGKTTLVLSKDESTSYAAAKSETEEGQTMGSILPVVFLLIAVLTMVTTMHRITAKEKTQIGILKALGFKNKRILVHYSSYAFMVGLLGSAIGIGLGYFIAWFIMNPNGSMGTYFDMPEWKLYMPWFCWLVVALVIVALTLIGFTSVKKILKGTAAEALQPYTPKKMKKLLIEKTALWKKFSFGTKWNLRDVMRHKSRTLMSLIGIIGCTLIIIGSLGMADTMNNYLDTYYQKAMNYETRIYLNDEATDEDRQYVVNKFDKADYSASVSVQVTDKNGDEKPVSLDIYNIKNGKIAFPDGKNGFTEITDDGVFVCKRIAESLNLKVGSEFIVKPYGTEKEYKLKVAGVMRSVAESIVASDKFADSIGIDYHIDSVYVSESRDEVLALRDETTTDTINGVEISKPKDTKLNSTIKTALSKSDIMKSFDTFLELMNQMIFVLIFAGVLLGVVVLYNLGVMSYTERYREMATLKVVGFKDKRIGGLLIGQNMWVTLVGVILGIPCGIGLLSYLMTALASEYELTLFVGFWSYLISVVITFGVSLLVSLLVSRKNKKIDMVEALKGAE